MLESRARVVSPSPACGRGSGRGVSAANALDFDLEIQRQRQLAALAPLTRLRRPLPQGEAKSLFCKLLKELCDTGC